MSPDQRYRLIALDVDGTLIDGRRTVSPRMKAAVRAAREAGATVSLATGRMLRSAARFAEAVGADGPIICYQGALTMNAGATEILRKVSLGPRDIHDALAVMRDAGVHINVYVDDEIYVESVSDWASGYSERMEVDLRVLDSLDVLSDKEPLAILGVMEPDAGPLVQRLRSRLAGRARVTHSLRHFCEVGGIQGGKRVALEHMAGLLGFTADDAIAFGDGQGDEEMIEWAALGVAVGDAHPDVVSAADVTVDGPEADGPARLLEQLLGEGRIGSH